jgi:hypothetical protein
MLSFLVFSIQIYDIQNLFNSKNLTHEKWEYDTPLEDSKWRAVFKHFDAVLVYPLYSFNYSMTYQNDYQDLSFLALKEGKPISNAYLARVKMAPRAAVITEVNFDLKRGDLSEGDLFVTNAENVSAFENLIASKKATIRKLNNFYIIFTSRKTQIIDNILKLSKLDLENISRFTSQFKFNATKLEYLGKADFEVKNEVKLNIELFEQQKKFLSIRGWAFYKEGQKISSDSLYLVFRSSTNNETYRIYPRVEPRPDVANYFNEASIKDSGFNDVLDLSTLPAGAYKVDILFSSNKSTKAYCSSEKEVILKD